MEVRRNAEGWEMSSKRQPEPGQPDKVHYLLFPAVPDDEHTDFELACYLELNEDIAKTLLARMELVTTLTNKDPALFCMIYRDDLTYWVKTERLDANTREALESAAEPIRIVEPFNVPLARVSDTCMTVFPDSIEFEAVPKHTSCTFHSELLYAHALRKFLE